MSVHHHDYVEIGSNPDVQIEVCKECKKKLVTKRNGGKAENLKYLKEHIRDTAQPHGATGKIFSKYYGKPKG